MNICSPISMLTVRTKIDVYDRDREMLTVTRNERWNTVSVGIMENHRNPKMPFKGKVNKRPRQDFFLCKKHCSLYSFVQYGRCCRAMPLHFFFSLVLLPRTFQAI